MSPLPTLHCAVVSTMHHLPHHSVQSTNTATYASAWALNSIQYVLSEGCLLNYPGSWNAVGFPNFRKKRKARSGWAKYGPWAIYSPQPTNWSYAAYRLPPKARGRAVPHTDLLGYSRGLGWARHRLLYPFHIQTLPPSSVPPASCRRPGTTVTCSQAQMGRRKMQHAE